MKFNPMPKEAKKVKVCKAETMCLNPLFSHGYCKYHWNQKQGRKNIFENNKLVAKMKSPKRKATGEAELFKEIWLERTHECVNCEKYLSSTYSETGELQVNPIYFDHIETKSRRPDLRLSKKNIRLLCFECHYIRHNGTGAQFEERKKTYKYLGKTQ